MLDEVALQRLHSGLGSVRPEDPEWSAKVKALLLEQGITPADLIELLKAGIEAELQRPPPSRIEQLMAEMLRDTFDVTWRESAACDGRPSYWAQLPNGRACIVRQCPRVGQLLPAWTASVDGRVIADDSGRRPRYYAHLEDAKSAVIQAANFTGLAHFVGC